MKSFRLVLITAAALLISMISASPVLAQVSLPYITDLVIAERNRTTDVGDFTVDANGTMTFQIDETSPWRLAETALYVGDTPPRRNIQGRLAHQHNRLNGASSDVYNVDLAAADRNGDGIVYVAAQAELVRQAGRNPRFRWQAFSNRETAWAQGEDSMGRGRDQGMFFAVSLTVPTTEPGGPVG